MFACLGEYIVLLANSISACFKTLEGKTFKPLFFVETLSPLAVLALTCILLMLSWLHLYNRSFNVILVVSSIYIPYFETSAEFYFYTQEILASISISALYFALLLYIGFFAGRLAVRRSFSGSARLDDNALELADQRPGTSPSARQDKISYPLPVQGIDPGNLYILSEAIDKADSSVGIDWESFDRNILIQPR